VAKPTPFCFAVGVTLLWAITGPLVQFSDTWQLAIKIPKPCQLKIDELDPGAGGIAQRRGELQRIVKVRTVCLPRKARPAHHDQPIGALLVPLRRLCPFRLRVTRR
jgi:Low affinity iron permease